MDAWLQALISGGLVLLGVIIGEVRKNISEARQQRIENNAANVTAKVDTTEQVLNAWEAYASAQKDQINHLVTRLEENEVRLRQSEERSAKCEAEKGEIRRQFLELELKLVKANLLPSDKINPPVEDS